MSRRPAWLVRARPEASSLVIKVVELTNELGLVTRRTRGWGNPEIPSKIPLSPQSKAEGPHIPYFHRKSTVPPTYHTCLISGPVAARHSLRSATCVRDHLALASRPTYAPPPARNSAHAGAPRRHARAVSVGAGGGRSRAAVPSAAAGVAEALAGRAERGAGGGGGAKGGTGGAVQRGGPRRGLGACLARRGGRGLQQAARVPLYVGQHLVRVRARLRLGLKLRARVRVRVRVRLAGPCSATYCKSALLTTARVLYDYLLLQECSTYDSYCMAVAVGLDARGCRLEA